MKKFKLELILVNLISFDYLVRYQAPLPSHTLAGYLRVNTANVKITVIDMQEVFNGLNSSEKDEKISFNMTIAHTIKRIQLSRRNTPVIVGLSMKWTTKEVAAEIIGSVQSTTGDNEVLFVIGNIMATYGYQHILETPQFKNVIAVVGEGEDAMVGIVERSLQNLGEITNSAAYQGIANVAIKTNGKISVDSFKRLNLSKYPSLIVPSASDIFDKEWRVYAIETSRGCPWGKCTFCSIKKQFGDCSLGLDKRADWRWKGFPLDKILRI